MHLRPKRLLTWIVASLACGLTFSQAGPAIARTAVPLTPTPLAQIVRVDPNTGAQQLVWTGSRSAQRSELTALLATTHQPAPRTASHGESVSPATGIHRVNCGNVDFTTYFLVHNYPPYVCFANAGILNVMIYQVDYVDDGNNYGDVYFQNDHGSTDEIIFHQKYTAYYFTSPVTVVQVTLSATS